MTTSLRPDALALAAWRQHPAKFVRDVFRVTPDAWQDEILEAFPHNQRLAMKACRGPGKSCVMAWIALNFLLTREHPKIACTSISGDNLADGLWSELAKWLNRSDILADQFTWTKSRIFRKASPETWFVTARTWPKAASNAEVGQTLSGIHSDNILFILDESGSMPEAIMLAAEAALSSAREAHILQAGNPAMLEGPLYKACTRDRALWFIAEITGDPDAPNRSPRIDEQWARDMIAAHGRDDNWVRVNILGQFPTASLCALIGPDEIVAATERRYSEADIANSPRVLGVDVARFGDDMSVVWPRQGLVAYPPMLYRGLDSTHGAGLVATKWRDWDADACFIDSTGGFGSGWEDNLRRLGYAPIGIHFSQEPRDRKFFNARSEMIFLTAEAIKNGLQLPSMSTPGMPELLSALTETTYYFKNDRIILEDKDQLKKKTGRSPDELDALGLTFAQPVGFRRGSAPMRRVQMAVEWDPYAERRGSSGSGARDLYGGPVRDAADEYFAGWEASAARRRHGG